VTELLQAFNDQLELRTAFGFSGDQIFTFLENVLTNPTTGQATPILA
jgi:hypothetical protein